MNCNIEEMVEVVEINKFEMFLDNSITAYDNDSKIPYYLDYVRTLLKGDMTINLYRLHDVHLKPTDYLLISFNIEHKYKLFKIN